MFLDYALLFLGFFILIKSADFLIEGSASLAKKLKIPTIVIALTVISFGTSAPELIVSVGSALKGSQEMALGGIVGSNISNTLLILGVASLIYAIRVKYNTTNKEIPTSLLTIVGVLLFIFLNLIFEKVSLSQINWIDNQQFLTELNWVLGIFLLIGFGFFSYYIYKLSKSDKDENTDEVVEMSLQKSLFLIFLGLLGLALASNLVVDNAIKIATFWGVSQNLIGLTIVALGTSLPELFTAISSALKKQADMIIGNVVGSNILNLLFVLGITLLFTNIPITGVNLFDMFVLLATTIALMFLIEMRKKGVLGRFEGFVFILLYVVYLIYIFLREF